MPPPFTVTHACRAWCSVAAGVRGCWWQSGSTSCRAEFQPAAVNLELKLGRHQLTVFDFAYIWALLNVHWWFFPITSQCYCRIMPSIILFALFIIVPILDCLSYFIVIHRYNCFLQFLNQCFVVSYYPPPPSSHLYSHWLDCRVNATAIRCVLNFCQNWHLGIW